MSKIQQVSQTDHFHLSKDKTSSKSQAILQDLNLLQEKICQGAYSLKNNLHSANPLLDSSTAAKITLITCLSLLSFHLRSEDQIKLGIFKLVWVISLFFYSYHFPPRTAQSLQKQLAIFFALRLIMSSLTYSFVTGNNLSFEDHIKSQEYDILVNVLLTIMLTVTVRNPNFDFKDSIYVQFTGYLSVSIFIQISFGRFEYLVFLNQTLWFLSLSFFYEFLDKSFNKDAKLIQNHSESLSQGFENIKQKFEQEILHASILSASVVEDLAMKIKYLKFSLLQKENDKSVSASRPVFSNTRRRTYVGPYLEPASPFPERNIEQPTTPLSGFKFSSSNVKNITPIYAPKNHTETQWKIVAEDCDNLLKLLSTKKTNEDERSPSKKQLYSNPKETTSFVNGIKSFENNSWNKYLDEYICNWNFDTLKLKELTNGNHMVTFGNGIMKKFNMLNTLNTTSSIATNFLKDVSEGYLPNAYHNSIHGADVCNAVGYFLSQPEFGGKFSQLEISCTLISALVHDIGHPGLNNAFLIATKSANALLYNDQSVLENFHTAEFYKILQKSSSNILQNLNEKDSKYFRKLSINLILDTDLSKHFMILNKFKSMQEPLQLTEESDRFMSLSVALKCADVSHGAKELGLHKKWSRRIIEEFYIQGDQERKLNIPVTPTCDRTGNISKGQQGFLNFIVLPLFEAFDQKFFTVQMKKTVTQQIKNNLEYWQSEIPHEEKGKNNFMEETNYILKDIALESGEKPGESRQE